MVKDLPNILNLLGNLTYTLKIGFLLTFILARIHQMHVLHQFIGFQQEYRVEELPIVKIHWNSMERRMKAFRDTITTVIWFVTAIWFFEAQYRSWNKQVKFENDVISAFLFFCMCVLALNIYFWTSAKLMWVMYRRHRHEFKLHAFSLLS